MDHGKFCDERAEMKSLSFIICFQTIHAGLRETLCKHAVTALSDYVQHQVSYRLYDVTYSLILIKRNIHYFRDLSDWIWMQSFLKLINQKPSTMNTRSWNFAKKKPWEYSIHFITCLKTWNVFVIEGFCWTWLVEIFILRSF